MKMQKQSFRPVETSVGLVKGRDALYLNWVQQDVENNTIFLEMQISGQLASSPPDPTKDYLFFVRFYGVLAYQMIELDSAYNMEKHSEEWTDDSDGSCFDEVVNSRWIMELGGKVGSKHKHYTISAYDDVLDVVCERFEISTYQRLVTGETLVRKDLPTG
jgi:hypothetical protein